jgi:hypothetical protein
VQEKGTRERRAHQLRYQTARRRERIDLGQVGEANEASQIDECVGIERGHGFSSCGVV